MNQEVESDFLSVIPNLALQKLLLKGLIKCWLVVVNSKLLGTVKLNSKKLFLQKKMCKNNLCSSFIFQKLSFRFIHNIAFKKSISSQVKFTVMTIQVSHAAAKITSSTLTTFYDKIKFKNKLFILGKQFREQSEKQKSIFCVCLHLCITYLFFEIFFSFWIVVFVI